jgi:hypothetical protein
VDAETHARLVELSEASGETLMETGSAAAEALRRQRFAGVVVVVVVAELDRLRADPVAWAAYVADAKATSVSDGLG